MRQLESKQLVQERPVEKFGDLVSCDLQGPLCASYGDKFVYAIVFVDHFSGMAAVYGLQDKTSESAAEALRTFIADTAHLGITTRLLSDGGGEFYGSLESACVEERIEHLFSAPGSCPTPSAVLPLPAMLLSGS